ncbi:hypothetical protein ACFQ1I_41515 [Kitasatospora arboriphila]
MPEPRVLLDGLVLGESPRWHDDRLWFCDWGAHELITVDATGTRETAAASTPSRSASTRCPTAGCSSSPAATAGCCAARPTAPSCRTPTCARSATGPGTRSPPTAAATPTPTASVST